MLVLRRKLDEAIVINQMITVRVLAVEGTCVKLGILAPPEVAVVREELLTADRQHAHLRIKQAALRRETDPQLQSRLKVAIGRLHQSVHQLPTLTRVKAQPIPAQ